MKGVINELLQVKGLTEDRYIELLGWSLLAKRIIALSWFRGSNKNQSQKVTNVDIGYQVSSQKELSRNTDKNSIQDVKAARTQ